MARSKYPDYVSYLQAYTTLLVIAKSRLWKDRVRNGEDEAQHGSVSVDYSDLLGVSASRWATLSEVKRVRLVHAALNDLPNPYEALQQLPVLFQTTRERFGLCEDELKILLFLTVTRTSYPLMSVFGDCWDTKLLILYQDLSVILQMPLARIRRLLSAVGTLKKSGLIGDQGYHSDVPEPMESIVCALLDRSDQPIDELFNSVYECVDESAFTVGDFSHISRHITGLLHVLQDDSGPANVLIYGPPGTGKTELAKALVVHIGKVLYRLNPKNVSYDRSARMERIGAFYQLQAIVSHHAKAAILFDEVEEVFVSGDQSYAAPLKSLLNDLLETNRVPTIWVCNSVENFDPAFVRRFDYVLHVDYPDYTAKRSYLLSQKLSSRISSRGVEVVACHPCLGFGLLARVLKVVRSLPEGRYSENDNQLLAMLNEYLRAMGQPVLAMRERTTVEQHHLPNLFHISVPIDRLVQVFRQCGFGRLLFYGPSGTGKSTAARHVADQCGRGVKVYSGFELMTLCEHFGAGVVDTIFNEVDSAEEVLVLEDVAQCLTPKSWQLGGLVDIVSGRLWACLEQFHGYAIVITSGPVDDAEGVFDVSVSFKALQARQLAALERYAEGEIDALDTLALNRVEAVIDLNHPIKVEQTSVTLADFHRQWRRARVSEVANGSSKDERAKRRSTKRLSLVTSRGCASSPEMP